MLQDDEGNVEGGIKIAKEGGGIVQPDGDALGLIGKHFYIRKGMTIFER